jgi:hypothetical protein
MRWLAQHRALARRGAAVATAVVLSLGAAACGDDENEAGGDRDAKPLGEMLAGSVAPLAQCKDWVGGSRERKLATIDDIRAQVSRRDTGIRAPALTDEEALGLFDRACSNRFARSFRLYVLYARAAGFIPLTRDR